MTSTLAHLQRLNGTITLPEGNSVTLRAESLPDLTRHMDILKGRGWEEDGAMNYGSMQGERTFFQKMKKTTP